MKKTLSILAFLSCCLCLPAAGEKFFASAGAAVVFPGDSGFKKIYAGERFGPELKAGYNFAGNFNLWLGFSMFSARGRVPVVEDEARASQNFFSLGAGWTTRRGLPLQGELYAALLLARFREEAMGETASKSVLGIEAGAGLRYFLEKNLFLGISVSYAAASATVRFAEKDRDIILGGLRLSGRLGFCF